MSWEMKAAKMCRTVLDLRCDDNSPFRLTEYYIMETFKINYAYCVPKSKIIDIVNAVHNGAFEGSRKNEVNTAFRRLVRYGFLRSRASSNRVNGDRERHYEIAFGKKAKAKRKAMLNVNSDNQSAAA